MKTNEDGLLLPASEFKSSWYDQEDYMLVDIRENEEISSEGQLRGAFNLSLYDVPDKIDMVPTYLSLVICCVDGTRSEQLAKYVQNNGYDNVFFLEGGTTALFEVIPELKG